MTREIEELERKIRNISEEKRILEINLIDTKKGSDEVYAATR